MINLTLETLINYLGKPEKQVGNEYKWQCPLCLDTGRDNLQFHEKKGVLFCFANDSHARQILSDMYKNNKKSFSSVNVNSMKPISNTQSKFEHIFSKEKQEEFLSYILKCNNTLLSHEISLKFLLKKRGLTKETVEFTGLGIDLVKKLWVIPTYGYSTDINSDILGFEYRPSNLSKEGLHREKHTPNGLAMINCYTPQTEVLAVVEGYFDGFALWQYLNEKGQSSYYHITTPSNGVNSLLKYIPQIDFQKYKRHYLYIDNDNAGNSKASEILEKYPMFETINMTCGCKDFNEHYLKCIKHLSDRES